MKLQHPLQRPNQEDEQGIALVISLLMGMLLITAATGLVVRQLTARKLGASESYQQMAETAASNGFNRIIAVLNNSDESNYRGFLLTEDNQPSDNAADNYAGRYGNQPMSKATSAPNGSLPPTLIAMVAG